jgi:hypothetical protein
MFFCVYFFVPGHLRSVVCIYLIDGGSLIPRKMLDLVLLWISQLSGVWGLGEGAPLESWFVPNLVREF